MSNKTLLFKQEYEVQDEFRLPQFSPEDIGHILYTIEKGIEIVREANIIPLFESPPLRTTQFSIKFKDVISSTRLDITFMYKYSYKQEQFIIDPDVHKIDIVSFFTKIKEGKSEHRIYQIGRKYTYSIEDVRNFRDEHRHKSLEEKKVLLEEITDSNEFHSFHPKKKEYVLNILREVYQKLDNQKMYWKTQRAIEKVFGKQLSMREYVENGIRVEKNPFNVDLSKFSFLHSQTFETSITKSLLYKKEFNTVNPLPEFTVEDIISILEQLQFIADVIDYESSSFRINFRNMDENSRKDVTFHYANKIPVFQNYDPQNIQYEYQNKVIKLDIVWFFTQEREGKVEFRIYQIGRRYESEGFTISDLFGLGELNYDMEYYDKAINYFMRALELEPEDADILTSLGLAHVCKKKYIKAIDYYQKALMSEPEDAIIWDNLGLAYEYSNQLEKAKESFEKALSLNPDDEEIQKHLADLSKVN